MRRERRNGIERRSGHDRRRGNRLRERLLVGVIVACFAALAVGNAFAYLEARDAGGVAETASVEARAALASIADERLRSCQADELDRARARVVRRQFPEANLPPVAPPRDCQAEANDFRRSIATLFNIAATGDPSAPSDPEGG